MVEYLKVFHLVGFFRFARGDAGRSRSRRRYRVDTRSDCDFRGRIRESELLLAGAFKAPAFMTFHSIERGHP